MNRSNEHAVMKKAKSETEIAGLDLEHELPPANGDERPSETGASGTPFEEASGLGTELQKLKAERDSLLDRLARAQAEFETARRRATKSSRISATMRRPMRSRP